MRSCFLKLFKINTFPAHSNQPSSFPLDLIEQFLYKWKIAFKLIKTKLYKAKISVMKVRSRTPAASKMKIFVTTVEGTLMQIWKSYHIFWVHIKTTPWKFRILIPKNSGVTYQWSLFFFWKSRLPLNIFYCFCMFVNKHFRYLGCA